MKSAKPDSLPSLFGEDEAAKTHVSSGGKGSAGVKFLDGLSDDFVVQCCDVVSRQFGAKSFAYIDVRDEIEPMGLVEVEFGRQAVIGVCSRKFEIRKGDIEATLGIPPSKMKPIGKVLHKPLFTPQTWSFVEKFAAYNVSPIGHVVDMALPLALMSRYSCFALYDFYPVGGLPEDVVEEKLKSLGPTHKNKARELLAIMAGLNGGPMAGAQLIDDGLANVNLLEKMVEAKLLLRGGMSVANHAGTFGSNRSKSSGQNGGKGDGRGDSKNDGDSGSENDAKNSGDGCGKGDGECGGDSCGNGDELVKGNKAAGDESAGDGGLNAVRSLNQEQAACVEAISAGFGKFDPFFVYGVTGSGKTEVYASAVLRLLECDPAAQVLMLLPEITMTSSMVKRLQKRFGEDLTLWHSGLSTVGRQRAIKDIVTGRARVVLGVRSAILMPYKNLKLIIVDEEHDSSYKQDDSPTYNARDMAVLRAKVHDIPVVLGSATPSVETYYNGVAGKYKKLEMKARFSKVEMPEIRIQDVKQNKLVRKILTNDSIAAIKAKLKAGEQAMIFINRRGYSRMMECSGCGSSYECENCDNQLVYHLKSDKLICHYCNHKMNKPQRCVHCGQELKPSYLGAIGIERVEEELKELSPDVRVALMSSDTMADQEMAAQIMDDIEQNRAQVVLSTQIGSKGYNFPNLNLVVAIGVDIDHIEGDPRIFEKTYQLLTQVCGRAGRFGKRGEMIVQTRNPKNPVLLSILSDDPNDFYKEELERRKRGDLPPYCRQVGITVASADQDKSYNYTMQVYRCLVDSIQCEPEFGAVKLFGPISNSIHKMKKQYRYNMLLRHGNGAVLNRLMNQNLSVLRPIDKSIFVKIDVDPHGFL